MKINTRLKIAALVPALMALVICLAFLFSYNAMKEARIKHKTVYPIINSTNELTSLTTEYILYHEERPRQQFLELHNSIMQVIAAARFRDPEQQQLLNTIRGNTESMKDLFLKLVLNYDLLRLNEKDARLVEVEERLAGQLIVESRHVAADAARLETLTHDEITTAQTRTIALVILVVLIAAVPLTVVLARTRRSITASLIELRKGTELIGDGDLKYRLAMPANDELGELARSFDSMTERLQAVTVSKERLQQEAEERRKAEEKLRESEERYRSIFEGANDGIIACDLGTGKFLFVNKQMSALTGYTEQELLKLDVRDMHPPEDLTHVLEQFSKAAAGEITESAVIPVLRKDKSVIYCDIGASFFRNDKTIMVGFFRDITGRKKAEEDRERLIAELERSNRELEQFAYIASHDLLEPLRMISSYLEIIDKRYRDQLEKDAGEFIDYAVSGASHMKALLNDLLMYSRLGTKGRPFELTDLNISLNSALSNLMKPVEESRAEITSGNLPGVYADETQIVQLFQNLIGNAIKFRGGEPPRINIVSELKGNEWVIRVSDNGIGIDPKFFEKIFLIFQRLHAREKYPGTGIGLSICKKIVECHGGRIWVESEPGKGSMFYFTIPSGRKIQ